MPIQSLSLVIFDFIGPDWTVIKCTMHCESLHSVFKKDIKCPDFEIYEETQVFTYFVPALFNQHYHRMLFWDVYITSCENV